MRLAGMELHPFRVVLLVAVAVDTLTSRLRGTEHIVNDDLLVKILQAALVQRQFLVRDKLGRDEAIAEPRVYAVLGNLNLEGLETYPLTAFLGKHFHADALAMSSFR